ncbi:hypothetical protein [Gemmata sp.]|uniref:hypothetical protein n=1 Tax=Gemmata sp. TaxID=1914242 RepID=UPI003F7214FB
MTPFDAGPTHQPGILVLDPDVRAGADLARGMGAGGWRVWVAEDVASVIEIFRVCRHQIAVALVDLQSPTLHGGVVLAELAQCAPSLIRCAMSGEINPPAAAGFRRTSDVPLFTKPLSAQSLAFTLHVMICSSNRSPRTQGNGEAA